jgi:hypothetical protein
MVYLTRGQPTVSVGFWLGLAEKVRDGPMFSILLEMFCFFKQMFEVFVKAFPMCMGFFLANFDYFLV